MKQHYRRYAGFLQHALLRQVTITGLLISCCGAFCAGSAASGQINGILGNAMTAGKSAAVTEAPVTVYSAKKIITMDAAQPTATALAVAGKRIIAVGALDQIKGFLGTRKYKLDDSFKNRTLVPGFIDPQLHPLLAALTLSTEIIATEDWVLPQRTYRAANSQVEYLARLQRIHERMPQPNEWLLSWGYHPLWHGKLDRAALDEISGKRPIIIWHHSTQEFFLNTPALKALGITEAMTKSEAMNKGNASVSENLNWEEGHFWNDGVSVIAAPLLKVIATPERLGADLKQLVTYLHAQGITAYGEAGAWIAPELWKQYEKTLATDTSPLYGFFVADGKSIADHNGYENAVDATQRQIMLAPEGPDRKIMLPSRQIMLHADGSLASQLMQMKEGYLDGHRGEWSMPSDELERIARLYWNAGYQLFIDVNGDAGLDTVLDIIERRQQERPRADHRTVIVGMANAGDQQLERIKRLGVIVSTSPQAALGFADRYGKAILGQQRADAMARNASALRQGVPLSFHSGLPAAAASPLQLVASAVNRATVLDRVAGNDQKIAVDAALRAVTIEAAYAWRRENDIGSIATGKIANLTVLEKDPYDVRAEKLKDIVVWGTLFEGKPYPVAEANKIKPAIKAVPKAKQVIAPGAKTAAKVAP